jgi:glutathione synthase/RimK-type ligase-like ATP-grasp enzyme
VTDVVVLVEKESDWRPEYPEVRLATARQYLTESVYAGDSGLLVINLCRSQQYQSTGYYCSLLAEARGHRVIPSVRTGQDLRRPAAFTPRYGLDAAVRRFLRGLEGDRFKLDVLFGVTTEPAFEDLAREVFDTFRTPLLRIEFRREGQWRLHQVTMQSLQRLSAADREAFAAALESYLARRWRAPRSPRRYRYDLAILHDPEEAMPPSNKRAIRKFIEAGRKHGIDAELVTRRDYAKLAEFDALFIRVTTQVNHYSYRFARRAEREGMVVIDDPLSILRCSNKVYLAELLRRSRIPTPPSVVLAPGGLDAAEQVCGYPVVLKVPDGSFSRGVFKAENRTQLEARSREMFDHSELILAQAYTYTEFDWRVGVLNREPLYVSKYFMAKQHWQIVKHGSTGTRLAGGSTTMRVETAPREVVKTALRAANLIGDGFYGVDLKQAPNGDVVVIEVNDNPSVDAGVEDEVLGEQLYESVMQEFLRRLSDISP